MADINIPYNEYMELLHKLETHHNKILELEQNQQKILLETEQHTYEHVNGTKAIDIIVKDVRYINLDEFKEIHKQEIIKELTDSYKSQLDGKQKTIDSLTKHNKNTLVNLSKYKDEVSALKLENDKIIRQATEIESQLKNNIKQLTDEFSHKTEMQLNKYNSKILEVNAIKQKNITIESLTSEKSMLKQQIILIKDTVDKYKQELDMYKNKKTLVQRIFNK